MPEKNDFFGLRQLRSSLQGDQQKFPEVRDQYSPYYHLVELILETVPEAQLPPEMRSIKGVLKNISENVGTDSDEMKVVLGQLNSLLQQQLVPLHNFQLMVGREGIFSDAEESSQLFKKGISALSPQSVEKAIRLLESEVAEKKLAAALQAEVQKITHQKIEEAKIKGEAGLADLLLWQTVLLEADHLQWFVQRINSEEPQTAEQFIAEHIENPVEKKRWELEAAAILKMVRKLKSVHQQIKEEGDSPTGPILVMGKVRARKKDLADLSQEDQAEFLQKYYQARTLDSEQRALAWYPSGTYSGLGGYLRPDTDQKLLLVGPDSPICALHSFSRLHQNTRHEDEQGSVEARPFMVQPQFYDESVQIPDVTDGAGRHFFEISYFDGRPPQLPGYAASLNKRGVIPSQSRAVTKDFLHLEIDDKNLAHFQVGLDENDKPIYQNEIAYTLGCLQGTLNNQPVYELPIEYLADNV